MSRIRQQVRIMNSREDAALCMADIQRITLEADAARVEMEQRIKEVRDEYAPSLAALDAALEVEVAVMKDWAVSHPEEFGERKSLQFAHGDVGFRTGMPRAKPAKGATWDVVIENLMGVPYGRQYIRIKEEVDKEKIISDREVLGAERLKEMGVRICQDEAFFVEPRREPVTAEAVA